MLMLGILCTLSVLQLTEDDVMCNCHGRLTVATFGCSVRVPASRHIATRRRRSTSDVMLVVWVWCAGSAGRPKDGER